MFLYINLILLSTLLITVQSENYALRKPYLFSTEMFPASNGNDGVIDCTYYALMGPSPPTSFTVNLEQDIVVTSVKLYRRAAGCSPTCDNYWDGLEVRVEQVYMSDYEVCFTFPTPGPLPGSVNEITCDSGPLIGRYVTIYSATSTQLDLCEIEVYGHPPIPEDTAVNYALNKPTWQSSTSFPANLANDGDISCEATFAQTGLAPSIWTVNLEQDIEVTSLKLYRRADACSPGCDDVWSNLYVGVGDVDLSTVGVVEPGQHFKVCHVFLNSPAPADVVEVQCDFGPLTGSYVTLYSTSDSMDICEVKVHGHPANESSSECGSLKVRMQTQHGVMNTKHILDEFTASSRMECSNECLRRFGHCLATSYNLETLTCRLHYLHELQYTGSQFENHASAVYHAILETP